MTSAIVDKVVIPSRVFSASVEYVESPKLPPMLQRQLRDSSSPFLPPSHRNTRSSTADDGLGSHSSCDGGMDEFRILHPSLDLSDENGELSKLMLSKWSIDSGEDAFASLSLFCEVKLNEAKRMASWVESPNRFFATACCQLLEKYIDRIANHHSGSGSDFCRGGLTGKDTGHSAAFLRKIHGELVNAIFLPFSPYGEAAGDNYDNRVPYFTVRRQSSCSQNRSQSEQPYLTLFFCFFRCRSSNDCGNTTSSY